jgi:hypothetical protein
MIGVSCPRFISDAAMRSTAMAVGVRNANRRKSI